MPFKLTLEQLNELVKEYNNQTFNNMAEWTKIYKKEKNPKAKREAKAKAMYYFNKLDQEIKDNIHKIENEKKEKKVKK